MKAASKEMPWLLLCSGWRCMMRCKLRKRSCTRDWLVAFLDDLYITTRAPRARAALESVAGEVVQ